MKSALKILISSSNDRQKTKKKSLMCVTLVTHAWTLVHLFYVENLGSMPNVGVENVRNILHHLDSILWKVIDLQKNVLNRENELISMVLETNWKGLKF